MTTPPLGMGLAPIGTCPCGFGAPATTETDTTPVFTKEDGSRGQTKQINPVTRDYAVNPTSGKLIGGDAVQQQVYLALVTVKGSSVMRDLGQDFTSLKTIPENLQYEVETRVNTALARLIGKRWVELVGVTTELNHNKALMIRVSWRDLTRNITRETTI